MTTNIALFITCAPVWLLAGIGAATFALVSLPILSAALPAVSGFFVHARKLGSIRPVTPAHSPVHAMVRSYRPNYGAR